MTNTNLTFAYNVTGNSEEIVKLSVEMDILKRKLDKANGMNNDK